VLYGSVARGDGQADSDLDLLVSFADDDPWSASRLSYRLERATGRPVDVARFDRAFADDPLLVLQAIDEGRVLVDRDGLWPEVRSRRRAIHARAERAYRREMQQVREAIGELTERR
jgi:predicted nucleotidyltransferase